MTYLEALNKKHELEAKVSTFDRILKSFPRNSIDLVQAEYVATQEYRNAKKSFDAAFAALREFNGYFVKAFKKEYAATRKAYRQQLNQA